MVVQVHSLIQILAFDGIQLVIQTYLNTLIKTFENNSALPAKILAQGLGRASMQSSPSLSDAAEAQLPADSESDTF